MSYSLPPFRNHAAQAMTNAHILVVEDERHLADGICFNLEEEGYRVTVVADGPSALRVLNEEATPVDLLILDIMLPGMSGYAVCETLRDAGKNMPVLMLSARTLSEDRTRGFDVGADQYMTKPFELDELLSRVKNLLTLATRRTTGKARVVAADWIHFGQARVNFATHEVFVGENPVRMTPLELKLLHYFVDHPNRVIPRGELLERVWEMPAYMNTRAPDQFLRRLRKVFETEPARPRYFITIRDAGYRFVPKPENETDDGEETGVSGETEETGETDE
ncbi:MAG: response regulator transcription factor [Planctomycetales bacterium]|nr:response regulator transcription factor [Planctomycetales bacterium]MCA9227356.1 response regulator transcription factor [Planctomycetales bacterium]